MFFKNIKLIVDAFLYKFCPVLIDFTAISCKPF